MITDWLFYAVAVPAVMCNGMGKGGFSGLGGLSLPLMSLVVSPVQAVAITLPILMTQDVVSLWAYRSQINWRQVRYCLPGTMIGIAIGTALALRVTAPFVQLMVGVIAAGFVLTTFRKPPDAPPAEANWGKATLWSTVAGFTSFIANAGGPPIQVYLLPLKMRPPVYAGTMVMLFAIVNWVKFVAFIGLGQVSAANLSTSAVLMPVAIGSTFLGVWMVKRMSGARFYPVVRALTFAVGLKLIWDGASGLARAA
jgi:uncharacterized membrane protein YfcA